MLASEYNLNVSNLVLELLQLLLQIGVLLCHLLILLLPLVAFILKGLDLALEVAGLDISLSEPMIDMLARDLGGSDHDVWEGLIEWYNVLLR